MLELFCELPEQVPRAPFANTDAVQCLRKLDTIYILRCVVTDCGKSGSSGEVPTWITRVLQSILEPVLGKPLHAAVCQPDISLLRVHVIQPADRCVQCRSCEVRSQGHKIVSWSERGSRRISIAQVMITGQEHARVCVLRVHTDEIADVQVVRVRNCVG